MLNKNYIFNYQRVGHLILVLIVGPCDRKANLFPLKLLLSIQVLYETQHWWCKSQTNNFIS